MKQIAEAHADANKDAGPRRIALKGGCCTCPLAGLEKGLKVGPLPPQACRVEFSEISHNGQEGPRIEKQYPIV